MIHMTQSLEYWLFFNYRADLPLILFGHAELFTPEKRKEYEAWCQTEEGRSYLKGGSKYDENHPGNKLVERLYDRERCTTCDIQREVDASDAPACCPWYMNNVVCGDKTVQECPMYTPAKGE